MWRLILIATCAMWRADDVAAGAVSYSGSHSNSNGANDPYEDGKNDYDDVGYAPGFGFGYGFMDPYVFHQQLTAQILAQNAALQNAIASSITTGDATVTAGASNLPNDIQNYNDQIHQQQAAFFNNIQNQNHQGYSPDKEGNYAPSYSAAAASVGPDGGYQTAFISPENPNIPNISNRFAASSPGGFKGVSVSSYSSSSDINGKKTSHRGAQTTINDNGRITTYKVNS